MLREATISDAPAIRCLMQRVPSFWQPWWSDQTVRAALESANGLALVSTLEDWLDRHRLQKDYVPAGFKGYGVKARAVNGHEFGLNLSSEDKPALLAFLRTL